MFDALLSFLWWLFFFFQAEDGIRDLVRSRGLGDVYKRQLKYRVLITGGGANHVFLVQKLRELSNRNLQFEIPDASLVNYKEAIVFALLGYLRWQGENNVLSSVTGSIRDHCSGDIFNG